MEHNKKGQWGSSFGFLMAAVGSAVGLGNLWGFPYKMGIQRWICILADLHHLGSACRCHHLFGRIIIGT